MARQRIYIDTSVIGGYYDDEFQESTRKFFERVENKDFIIYFSEVNEAELVLAPQNVQDVRKLIPDDCYEYLELSDEIRQLALTYINEKVLKPASLNDAYHHCFGICKQA